MIVQEYIECRADVIIDYDTGHIEYGLNVIDEETICGEYICKTCKHPLSYMEMVVTDEEELEFYLNLSPEEVKTANDQYLEEEAEGNAAQMEHDDYQIN